MYVSILSRPEVVFSGTSTTPEERQRLRDAGFVHVTGLLPSWQSRERMYAIGEKLRDDELGKWGSNNGKVAIVTKGGEVWLAAWPVNRFPDLTRHFCPNGGGAFVPLSNGETVDQH